MRVTITKSRVRSILTRTSGYLKTVTSHSMQPYRGCTFGNSLCGVGCYVQHNHWLTRGAEWGSFLEVRTNAPEAYRSQYETERRWARRARGGFSIFLSSSTDPFVPQEKTFRITGRLLEAMNESPPDVLIVQTHTHLVNAYSDLYPQLARRCELRFHISIESDRDRLPVCHHRRARWRKGLRPRPPCGLLGSACSSRCPRFFRFPSPVGSSSGSPR